MFGSLWASEGDIGALWDHLSLTFAIWGRLWVILVLLWDHFGTVWGHFGFTLRVLYDHFGVTLRTLGSFWGHFACVRITLESLLAYQGPFSKTLIFPTSFNDFSGSCLNSGPFWDHFGLTFGIWGWLWVTLGSLGATLSSLWNHLEDIFIYEGEFKSLWVDFGITSGSLWGHFWLMSVTLNHFAVTLRPTDAAWLN